MENFRFCAVSTEKKDVDFNERLELLTYFTKAIKI